MSSEVGDDFIVLFRGRADCYGAWEGGCVKQPLTRASFVSHLTTGPYIGVYPSVTNGSDMGLCVWGCADIDYDSYADADLLRRTFTAVGIPSWVERTARGWHIWVFATTLVSSQDMRDMFLAAHQVSQLQPKEVNPKQTRLPPGVVGNYVRLPYPGALSGQGPDERYFVDNAGVRISLEEFVPQALAERVEPKRIAELAEYYIPPALPEIAYHEPTGDVTAAMRALTPLGRFIWKNGPAEGVDRSTTMVRLAMECAKTLDPSDALLILEDADLTWGKHYQTRGASGQAELTKLVQRAYARTP